MRMSLPRYLDKPWASLSSMGRVRRSAVAWSSFKTRRLSWNVAGTQFKANWRTIPLKLAASTTAGQLLASMLDSFAPDACGAADVAESGSPADEAPSTGLTPAGAAMADAPLRVGSAAGPAIAVRPFVLPRIAEESGRNASMRT